MDIDEGIYSTATANLEQNCEIGKLVLEPSAAFFKKKITPSILESSF